MKIELIGNTASTLRTLEDKAIMFYGEGLIIFFTNLKIEVIPETKKNIFGTTTRNVTYLTGGKFYGYNTDGDFVGVYSDEQIEQFLRYDLMALRRRYLTFEKGYKALLDKMDEIVAIKAGIHPSIIGSNL